jgi:peptidoglycan/LPS O-acetylase OafA/YrhL
MFPWNIVCAFVAAELSYSLLEKPFLRWRNRFSTAPENAAAPESIPLEPESGCLAASASA